jgi:hypothetical protein
MRTVVFPEVVLLLAKAIGAKNAMRKRYNKQSLAASQSRQVDRAAREFVEFTASITFLIDSGERLL